MEAFWLYLHILLLVFWVGTILGYSSPPNSRRRGWYRDPPNRFTAGHGARSPTPFSTNLIIPSGCQLAVSSQWMALPTRRCSACGSPQVFGWRSSGEVSVDDANVQEQS